MSGAFRFCFALLAAALPFAAAPATPAAHVASPRQARTLSALVDVFMARFHIPGGSVAIGLDGRTIWSRGFGLADVENHVPATPDNLYRTASIGKPMTATLAMMLAGEHRLDLDAPVQTYCPRYPQQRWPVLVRHLLSHSSGVRTPRDDDAPSNVRHYDHPSDAVELFANDPLSFEPGSDFQYSTWNYVLLGCVIEGAAAAPYAQLMQERIFGPAGMTHTRIDDPRAIMPGRARGYIFENGQLLVSRWVDMSNKLAAGGWVTTTGDLIAFMNHWMEGTWLPEPVRIRMLTPWRLNNHSTVDNYGMGWYVDDYHGMSAGLHGGGTPQISAIAFFVPQRRIAIAGFFNLEGVSGSARIALAEAMADVVLGEAVPNPNHFGP